MSLLVERCFNSCRISHRVHVVKNVPTVYRKQVHSVRLRRPRSEREPLDVETFVSNASITLKETELSEWLTTLHDCSGPISEDKAKLLRALKLSMTLSERSLIEFPVMGRPLLQKSISVASSLMSLFQENHPDVGCDVIATALIIEQVWKDDIPLEAVRSELGKGILAVVYSAIEIRRLIDDIDMIDDITAGECQKAIFGQFDRRSILLEFVSRLDSLRYVHLIPYDAQVPLALDCLYIHVAIGRLLQLPQLSNEMEDRCMRILFPSSYLENSQRVTINLSQSEDVFLLIRRKLQERIDANGTLMSSVRHVEIKTRVKSTSSFMRKLLSLSNLSRGGKRTEDIFDILGIRIVVWPRDGSDSEESAVRACYSIRDIACELWPQIKDRAKDYIKSPKHNGYQSLHTTHIMELKCCWPTDFEESDVSTELSTIGDYPHSNVPDGPLVIDDPSKTDEKSYEELLSDADFGLMRQNRSEEGIPFELQIRTKRMDIDAESGSSSHDLYKTRFGRIDYS